jgi:bifunctional DNase/RNase
VIEVTIHSVRVSLITQNRVVVLMEVGGDRYLPIWIGPDVADAIVLEMQEVEMARPLTHDLLCAVIGALGAKVNWILVNDIHDNIFYARIIFDVAGRYAEVDSRPSDALALAVRSKCPIYVEEAVMEQAGLVLEKEAVVGEGEEKDLGVFRDFLSQLGRAEPEGPEEEGEEPPEESS